MRALAQKLMRVRAEPERSWIVGQGPHRAMRSEREKGAGAACALQMACQLSGNGVNDRLEVEDLRPET